SFLPIFALEAQEGRLFKPLAFTKNFSMAIANAVLVGTIHREERHPISRPLMWLYHPVVEWVLRWPRLTIAVALLAVAVTVYPFAHLKSEFMPSLNEGTILYMPTALPGMSITQARAAIQTQDRMLRQ